MTVARPLKRFLWDSGQQFCFYTTGLCPATLSLCQEGGTTLKIIDPRTQLFPGISVNSFQFSSSSSLPSSYSQVAWFQLGKEHREEKTDWGPEPASWPAPTISWKVAWARYAAGPLSPVPLSDGWL